MLDLSPHLILTHPLVLHVFLGDVARHFSRHGVAVAEVGNVVCVVDRKVPVAVGVGGVDGVVGEAGLQLGREVGRATTVEFDAKRNI